MPHKTQDTISPEPMQATATLADEWAREVVARLPENMQQQARVLKAFGRSRQIRSASDLLRGLLAYVYTVHSFQHLSIWSLLVGVVDVSATNWRKRLQRASAWLTWLLQEVLAASSSVSPWLVRGGRPRVLLIDGTHIRCPGLLGMLWRVHTAFDQAFRAADATQSDRSAGGRASGGIRAASRGCGGHRSGQWLTRTDWLCAPAAGRCGGALHAA